MHTLLTSYLIAFVLSCWPSVAKHHRQNLEMRAIASEVATLRTTPGKMLRLMNIAALESGFDRTAKGKAGECGARQILGGHDCSAREALRRMDEQGMVAYVGCRHIDDPVVVNGVRTTCRELVAHRVDKADLYSWTFAPTTNVDDVEANTVAGNP